MSETTAQTTPQTCAGCVRHDPQTAYCQLWGWTRRATDKACPERADDGKAEKRCNDVPGNNSDDQGVAGAPSVWAAATGARDEARVAGGEKKAERKPTARDAAKEGGRCN